MITATDSTSSQTHQSLSPARGVTAPPQDGASYRFLSDVIIARGLVDPAAMKSALQASLAGRSLTEILVERRDISEDALARALAEHHRLDHIDLDLFEIDHEAATLIGADVATRLGAIPIAQLPSGALAVAVHDPNGSPAARELAGLTDHAIQPVIASRAQIAATIDSLLRTHSGAPPAPSPDAAAIATPARRARPVVAASMHPADVLRPTAVPPMPPRTDNEDRVRAAEQRAHSAQDSIRVAGVRARDAEEREAAAVQRAKTAEGVVSAANARAEGLMAAAVAANEALARLVGNCEVLEREARAREGEMHALRSELGSERTERARLEALVLDPQAGDELIAMNVRVAELERELAEARAGSASPVICEVHVAPVPEVEVKAPQAYVAALAELAAPVDTVETVETVEPERDEPPSVAPRIDILGDPGVPYVRALAPMPPIAPPRQSRKNAKSATKAKGLRRLISALKR